MENIPFRRWFLLSLSNNFCALKKNSKISSLAFAVLFLGLFFSFSSEASAATYYVDATGGLDTNNGTSTGTAWQTLTKVSGVTLAAGDQVLFNRGQTFTGKLTCHNSGASGNPIIYADYGNGNKPIFTGSAAEGIICWGKNYITVQNIVVQNSTTVGLSFSSTGGITLNGVESYSNLSGGLYLDPNNSISDVTVTNSKFNNNGGRGISFYSTSKGQQYQRFYFDNIEANNNQLAGLYIAIGAGSSVITSWALSSSNVWYATLSNTPQNGILFNAVTGTQAGSVGAIVSPNQWYWDSGASRIYVYSISDPSTAYTQPGIQSPSKFYDLQITDSTFNGNGTVVNANNASGLTVRGAAWSTVYTYAPPNWSDGIVVDNITASGNGFGGISVLGFKSDVIQSYIKNSRTYSNGTVSTLGGIWTGGNDGLIIENNSSYNNTTPSGGIDGVGIFVDQWDTNCIVRNNNVYGNLGSSINNSGGGIAFWNSMNNSVYDNIIRGNKDGITIGPAIAIGNKIYNNTIVNNTRAQINYWLLAAATSAEVKNNLLYGGQYGILNSATAPSSEDYNCVGGASIANYSGLTPGANSNSSCSPVFTDLASNDFTLQGTSQAVDAGTDVGLITDFAGNPKSGVNWDIGAYEFQDSTAPTTTASAPTGTYNSAQSVTLTCNDGAGVGCDKTYYTTDGTDPDTNSNQYSAPIVVSSTTTLKFFSRDRNENSEIPIKSKTYTIDTIIPNTTIDSNPNSSINTNFTTFTFSASETVTFQCKLDSGAYASCSTPKNYTSLVEGAHTFYVKATDTANNEDATPASYAFTVDTSVPTISDLSPNNITLSVTTTSTNLTLTTSESAICRYSTTSGTSYVSMTAFDSTNNTTHSTVISGLNSGTTYDYYILCKDAINESAEEHLTFSIAPEENDTISLENIKIKVGREINKFKDTIRIAKNKLKLKQEDANLANGTVKIYKDNKRIDTIDIDSSGAWDKIIKLKDDFSGWIKIRQYDQFGTLLFTNKAKIKVDTEDPKFNEAIPEKITFGRNQKIYFTATDDNSGIDYYEVKLADVRDWRQQNEDFYQIPDSVPNGTYDLFIRTYDKAGNYAEEKTTLSIVRFKNSVNLTQVPLNLDSPTQNIENQIQNHTDKNTDTAPDNSGSSNSPSLQPQPKPSIFHWYNPSSWF